MAEIRLKTVECVQFNLSRNWPKLLQTGRILSKLVMHKNQSRKSDEIWPKSVAEFELRV
jgi:hypothetical protein